jgi:hypothetical protein
MLTPKAEENLKQIHANWSRNDNRSMTVLPPEVIKSMFPMKKIDFFQVTLRIIEYSSATISASDSPIDPERSRKTETKTAKCEPLHC